jgi:Zn-dependent oligopeptidase
MDPTTLFNQVDEKLTLQPIPDREDRGHPHVYFGHLLSRYDAGYYSYLRYMIV